jgi:hypothetical protein
MKGSEIALATLMRENVDRPCVNYSWMTDSSDMSRVAGFDYWSDREGVFFEYLHQCGINLVSQWYLPGEEQRNIERGHVAHEHRPGGISVPSSCHGEFARKRGGCPTKTRFLANEYATVRSYQRQEVIHG